MRAILAVGLRGFYVRALRAIGKLVHERAVVHRDKRVLDAAGLPEVRPGMPLAEAKLLAEGAPLVAWEDEDGHAAAHRWLLRCAEFSDVVEPEAPHFATLDLTGHPDPIRTAFELRQRLGELYPTQIGLASTAWIARILRDRLPSEPGAETAIDYHLALTHPDAIIADWPTDWLTPALPEERRRLEFLGYGTIGAVAGLPMRVLRRQFGDRALLIAQAAQGRGERDVQALFPPDAVSARRTFQDGLHTQESLVEALREIAHEIAERLANGDRVGKRVEANLQFEDAKPLRRERTFSKPIQSVGSAYAALALLLRDLPEAPVTQIRVRLPEVTRATRTQPTLEGSRKEREVGAAAAMKHVKTTFGDASIQIAGELAEPRRRKVLRAWRDTLGWS